MSWLADCHALERDGDEHPLQNKRILRHTLERLCDQFGDAGEAGFAMYAANQSRGEWTTKRWGKGIRIPSPEQDMQARCLAIDVNRLLNKELGGRWVIGLGEWTQPPLFIVRPDGTAPGGGYDMLLAMWLDPEGDSPFVADYEGLVARGFPRPADYVESCAKAWQQYERHIQGAGVTREAMTNKAQGDYGQGRGAA